MTVVLYDLAGREDRRFSPHCWRVRMALAHKGLDPEARPVRFTDIPGILDGQQRRIPVIQDGEEIVADSWAIARYLEDSYPDRPALFGMDGEGMTRFVQYWVHTVVQPGLVNLIILDIHDHLDPQDQDYFRQSREQRFGRSLEAVQADRDQRLGEFRKALEPARRTVQDSPYLGGETPRYADYLLFGALQWSRVISPLALLEADDPLLAWFGRCLDLYDGLGWQTPGYDWPGLGAG